MDFLALLRRRRLAAAMLGLAFVLLAPLATASVACEIACALDASPAVTQKTGQLGTAHSTPASHHGPGTRGDRAAPHSASCAMTSIALPMESGAAGLQLPPDGRDWQTGVAGFPRSQVWPPPEHRPRT